MKNPQHIRLWQSARILALLCLLSLAAANAAPSYQETGWEALIPEAERINDVDTYLKQISEQSHYQDETRVNPALEGKPVMMRGFVVPLEREDRSALREFLLVPYFGACIHTPPPPANQIIHVHAKQTPVDIQAMTPVTVYGSLSLEGSSTKEGNAAYQLQAHKIEALRPGVDMLFPALLTLFCGLSACIGALAAFLVPKAHTRAICLILGFAAGIMLWLGLSPLTRMTSGWQIPLCFLAGVLSLVMLEYLLRHRRNSGEHTAGQKRQHAGEFSALAVAAHNFPECLAVFSAALTNPATGMILCGAVMAHHLPLGLSIALPLKATGAIGYRKSIIYAFFAGLFPATSIVLMYLLIKPLFSPASLGLFFSFAGGIMVFIAVTKLIPAARSYGNPQTLAIGLIAGLLFAFSVLGLVSA
ncbi:MAG: DUF3299 domain-containing protein [Betaproteobacteria bacterium]|nr:DUF3299 domain-containing protein [Betaproteobacteria bacterium]